MVRKRSLARQVAMKVLFQLSLVETDISEALEYFREDLSLAEDVVLFARELVDGTASHFEEIDKLLRGYLEKWDLDRIGNVEKAILRLATFELLYRSEIPPRVTINEAVEMSKEYSSVTAGKFINGVLDRVAKSRSSEKAV
ncbi:MAG: transcription antitermination factor NusB [Candidatus Wallbacteria bacterium]|nr:transcription antitermination factor NusB [Candidatus Wallbacteria bacterium]